jgi:hypothetical protein
VKPEGVVFVIFAVPVAFWLGTEIAEVLASLIVGLVVT